MTFLIIKFNENSRKWYKNKVAVTGSNQWKVDNKIVKFQRNISFIFKTNSQWNLIINLNQIDLKLRENQIKSCTTPYSKLRENHWKLIINSFKINENQWNLCQKLRENQLFFTKSWQNKSSFYQIIPRGGAYLIK